MMIKIHQANIQKKGRQLSLRKVCIEPSAIIGQKEPVHVHGWCAYRGQSKMAAICSSHYKQHKSKEECSVVVGTNTGVYPGGEDKISSQGFESVKAVE